MDSNQNHLQPGTMLTSMVKRMDVAVYTLFKKTNPGQLTVLGLKEGGVDYALDQHNAKLVTAEPKRPVAGPAIASVGTAESWAIWLPRDCRSCW